MSNLQSHDDKNSVKDADSHFTIDTITRDILNQSGKTELARGDHNSERITFECDRYIDGHDMFLCNVVSVHYFSANTPGLYDVDDLAIVSGDESKVSFTWLVSSNVTQNVGKILFAISFRCVQDSGEVTYCWNTKINEELSVFDTFNNSSFVVETNIDILNQWKHDLFSYADHHNYLCSHGKDGTKPIISFIDDDCKVETYNKLFPIIKEMGIAYTLACPPLSIGTNGFMSLDQLKEMYEYGVDVSSHHLNQYNMTQFGTIDEYENDLSECDRRFLRWGIQPVNSICYPQGVYVDEYMPVVRNHYKIGFTIDRGINYAPYESFFMKRCEIFPTNSLYTLDDAKSYVDKVASDGGWLVFMTHAWYSTFSEDNLRSLISYIKSKNVDIVTVKEGMEMTGNIVDIGILKKPMEYMYEPFFVVDRDGKVYTNSLNEFVVSSIKRTKIQSGWNSGYNLSISGKAVSHSDKKRLVSEKITANPGEVYHITASATYANALYVIYDANNAVIAYRQSPNTVDGEVITDLSVTMPDNTSYFKVASNVNIQPEMYAVYKVTSV